MASVSRIFARNLLPRPSPLEAPFTRPSYIHDLDSGGHHTARVAHLHKFIKTLIGHRDHTGVGFYRTEREIR